MWRLGSLTIGNRAFEASLSSRLSAPQGASRGKDRGRLCFMVVGSELCSDTRTIRERLVARLPCDMAPDWVLMTETAEETGGHFDEPFASDSIASVLARNDLVVVLLDSRCTQRSAMLEVDRFRIGLSGTRWLVFDRGRDGAGELLFANADHATGSFAYRDAAPDLRIRSAVDAIIFTVQTGITKRFGLADYSCSVGAEAEVVGVLHGVGVGSDRALAAVDDALSADLGSIRDRDRAQGALVAIAVPAGGNLGEFYAAVERARDRLPGTCIIADFVSKEAGGEFEIAIIVTQSMH